MLSSHWDCYCGRLVCDSLRSLTSAGQAAHFFGGVWMFAVDSSGTVCRSTTSRAKRLAPSVVWNVFAVVASGMSGVGSSGTAYMSTTSAGQAARLFGCVGTPTAISSGTCRSRRLLRAGRLVLCVVVLARDENYFWSRVAFMLGEKRRLLRRVWPLFDFIGKDCIWRRRVGR